MPGARRSVGAAKQRAGSSGGTGPTGNNNASDIYIWGNDYYGIIQKEIFGNAPIATTQSLTVWNDLRKVRGVLGGAVNGGILSTNWTPYHYYDGTTTNWGPSPYNGWGATENAYPSTTGHFATYTATHAPAGGSGVNKTFAWRTGFGAGVRNYQYGTSPYVVFQPWHDDTAWGSSGTAAAITAGEGSAAWATAVASALTPNQAPYGALWNNVRRTLLWDWMLLCQSAAAYGFTHSFFDLEDAGDANSGGMGTQGYLNNPGYSGAQIKLLVKLRGQQMATIQASILPNSDMGLYYQKIPGSLRELNYYRVIPGFEGFADQATAALLAGWASVSGIRRVFVSDATFYKGQRYFFPCSYDNAFRYDHMGSLAHMSTMFTDAERKAGMARMAFGAAIWPTNGVAGNEVGNGLPVQEFQDALRAAVKWGMGGGRAGDTRPGRVAIYASDFTDARTGTNTSTDHQPYEAAFQAEAVPGIADAVPPVVTCAQGASSAGSAATIVLSGTITDNMAPYRVDVTNAANGATYGCQWTRVVTFPGWNSTSTDMVSNDITARGDWFSPPIPVAVGANVISIDGYDTHDNKVTITHTYTRDPDLLSLFQSRYPASGAEIWVDGTLGNDGAAGTAVAPKATIQAAINVSVAGSKIMVRPYGPGYATITFAGHSGTANNYIQLIASGATSMFSPGAKINCNGGAGSGSAGVSMIGNNNNFIAMWGFEVTGLNSSSAPYEVGVMPGNGAHDIAVWGCYFHDLASHAVAAPGAGGQGWQGVDRIDVCYNRITHTSRWNPYQGSGISMISQANLAGAWADGYRNHIIGNVIDGVFTDPNAPNLTPPFITDGNSCIFDISGGYAGRTLVAHNVTVGAGGRGIHTLSFNGIDAWFNTSCDSIQNLPGTWVGEFSIQDSSDCHFGWNVGAAKVGSNRVGNFQNPGTSTWSDTVFLRGTGGSEGNDPSVNSFNNINKTQVGPANYFNQYQQGVYQQTVITNVAGFRPKLAQVVTGNPPANIRAAVAPWPDALGVLRPASGPWAYGAFEAA